ncbi:hypothetical protein HN51_069202 [Arachis hypogaea]|uniref:uncharacterized protein LOC107643306 isoform X3 n=1 Tax=Arachis ipaensis TaxID=130454 RepID=UPI0007AF5B47|nr:uncharacterized protein LOC107643306 isoform X3 [Arachis ipaensis]XP_025654184.1 uncharacterized protein LOC112749950 isoform X1 [Arachis hypogaea]QHO11418.1 uncharacterized protein DS421_15g497910 [Arachis hypogaea]
MGVDARFAFLLQNLRLQDPWVPPSTWESIPSESGLRPSFPSSSVSDQTLSALSESSLVRLATNALQGVKSSVLSIQQLSALFCSDPADRTFHHISSLWNRASSTRSLGNLLTSIGSTSSLVILIREFVGYFTIMNLQDSFQSQNDQESPPYSLVNQAFAVAVGKVLEGYLCGLDTVHASIALRHSSKDVDVDVDFPASGCLKSVVHSEITLLEFYLHTKELRTWVEALASICNLQKWVLRFSEISLEEVITEATAEFRHYYRGGDLLTFLYAQLQVADTAHCTLLKFLFLQSCEPYCGFIRSWIFKAEIHDPYKEFIVENMECLPPKSHLKSGNSMDVPSTHIRVRDDVSIPEFLKDFLVPLVRAGQQLQVLLKLVELCVHVTSVEHSSEDFLPCWSGFASSITSYSSPLTFSRDVIDVMVIARENYFERMNEKIDSLLSSLEIRYQRVATHASVSVDNVGGDLDKLEQVMEEDESIVRSTADKRSSNMDADSMDSDSSRRLHELSLLDDMYSSSESLSLNGSEEQLDSDQHHDWPCLIVGGQNQLSALSFLKGTTLNSSIQDCCHHEKPGSDSHGICDKTDASDHLLKSSHEGVISNNMSNPLNSGNSKCPCAFSIQYRYSMTDSYSEMGNLLNNSVDDDESIVRKITEKQPGSLGYSISCHDVFSIKDNFIWTTTSEAQPDNNSFTSNLYTLQLQKVGHKYNIPNLLSMNPMLTRNELLHWMDGSGERFKANHERPFPYVNFSTVEDPCKVYMDKLFIGSRATSASSIPLNGSAANYGNKNTKYGEMGIGTEDGLADIPKQNFGASLDLMDHKQDAVVSGGSTWERLLHSFSDTKNCGAKHSHSFSPAFEIPLDIILDKCLLQEIMLQYKYVSRLTINVLEEVFELQEHLLALRRYHFMELADWADLFILSLWHHKWSVTEANERLSEIQGLLELAIQKSSCEQDPNKDRLFVYMKGHGKLPLSNSAIGVRSFDFLGLGYRVDWPLSIVLTPAASKLYADIFNFLIQVKLAIFSLTDVWRSLKDLVHTTEKDLNSELHHDETQHLNILTMMRHQINHFVSTLQQYVESQLSRVSWCKLLHSLQHKVKDMMDLESVHMEYLADSLCICFLSDDTRAVGGIIESILQCALDFRSCLTVGVWRTGSSWENLSGKLSKINIPQVLSIKQKFDRSLKELHNWYIKEPKHGKFGRHFWESLDYNKYYSHVINEMGQYGI